MRKLIVQTILHDEQYNLVFTDIMKVIKADGQDTQHTWER